MGEREENKKKKNSTYNIEKNFDIPTQNSISQKWLFPAALGIRNNEW